MMQILLISSRGERYALAGLLRLQERLNEMKNPVPGRGVDNRPGSHKRRNRQKTEEK